MDSARFYYLLWLPLLAYLLWFSNDFAWFDGLASIASDSSNYLVMARYLSPWVEESPAIAMAWQYEDFPPLFPLLLAVTGAAHSYYWAHVLVTILGLACVFLFYRLVRRDTGNDGLAIGLAAVVVLTPGYLFALQGILSEALFLLLSLSVLLLHDSNNQMSPRRVLLFSILLAALVLTRTVGIVMWLAFLIYTIVTMVHARKLSWTPVAVLLLSILFFFTINFLFGADRDSHYAQVLVKLLHVDTDVISLVVAQLGAVIKGWNSYWLIYWHDDFPLSLFFVSLLGLAGLLSIIYRLVRNVADLLAWYLLGYLCVLIIWPHPGQMVRLMMPIVPLVMLAVFHGMYTIAGRFVRQQYSGKLCVALVLVMLAITVPSHAYMQKRMTLAGNSGLDPLLEIFRIIPVDEAAQDVVIQSQMLSGFASLSQLLTEDESILYYEPSYPALLGGIRTEKLELTENVQELRESVSNAQSTYLLLTYYHPRKKRQGVSGMLQGHLEGVVDKVSCAGDHGIEVICLYAIRNR